MSLILGLEHHDNYQSIVSVSNGTHVRYVRIKSDVADSIRDLFLAASRDILGAFNSIFEPPVEGHVLSDTESPAPTEGQMTGQGDLIEEIDRVHLVTAMRGH